MRQSSAYTPFSSTGNWSEVKDLEEKGIQKSNRFRKRRVQLFLIAILLFFAFLFYKNILSGRISLFIVIGLPVSMYYIYNYLKTEIGVKFRLPISKISNIEIENSTVIIDFQDSQNGNEKEVIKAVDYKGIKLFQELKDNIR